MLVKAKNKVNKSVALVPKKYLEFNKNYSEVEEERPKPTPPKEEKKPKATEDVK